MTTKIFILVILIYGNNNICLGGYVVGFMSIVTFKKLFLSMKREYFRVFMSIDTFKNYCYYEKGVFESFYGN